MEESKETRYIKRTFPSLKRDGKWWTLGFYKEVSADHYIKYILPTKYMAQSNIMPSEEYLQTPEEEAYTDLVKHEGVDLLAIMIGIEQAKVNKMKEILKLKQEEILAIMQSISDEAKD